MNQKIRFTMVLLLFVIILGIYSANAGRGKTRIDITEVPEEIVAVVDEETLTIADMVFYIAFVEAQVEEDAVVYNPENTREYWRLHANGIYIQAEAKQTALDMAIHDEVFYRLAQEEEMTLNEAEEKYLANTQYDFWSDLDEEQKEALGVDQEVLNESMRRVALAEKYQNLYAEMKGAAFEDYSYDGEAYKKLLENNCKYMIYEEVWKRVPFGKITVGIS